MRPASVLAGFVAIALAAGAADARELRPVAKVTVTDGVIADAFALDDRGVTLAYVHVGGAGGVRLHVGPPGRRSAGIDISGFTALPERLLAVGGRWFVVAGDGERKAALAGPGGRLGREVGPFAEALVGRSPPVLQTLRERPDKQTGGRVLNVSAYRPDGSTAWQKPLVLGVDESVAGHPGAFFLGFGEGLHQILVRTPGRYDRRSDARGASELATLDLRTGRLGAGKPLGALDALLPIAAKRRQRPGADCFVQIDDAAAGLELIGPGFRARAVHLPAPFAQFEGASLRQQPQGAGGRLILSLVAGPSPRRLHFIAVDPSSARATALGDLPLAEAEDYVWSAGGGRVALLRKPAGGQATELAVLGS